jgi:hypothetical protein
MSWRVVLKPAVLAAFMVAMVFGDWSGASPAVLPEYDYSLTGECLRPDSVSSSVPLSDAKAKAPVYAMERQQFDAERVGEIASALGIQATLQRNQGGNGFYDYEVEDSGGFLHVLPSGGYLRYHDARPLPLTDSMPAIPDAEAKDIASEFLQKLELSPKWPVDAAVNETTNSIEVRFTPRNVVPSVHTTETITVTLRKGGEVSQLEYYYQEPTIAGEYPIVSQADALERLRECRGIVTALFRDEMNVSGTELVYLGVPLKGPYEYLIPAYYFFSDLPDGTRQTAVIPAIADEYLTVNPPTPCPCRTPTPTP